MNSNNSLAAPHANVGATRHAGRQELERYLENLLQTRNFKDYCPNGVQVEGKNTVASIVSGVTASVALIQTAIATKADAILVHHGYFWRGEDARIIGQKQQRLKLLLQHDINLFAYHLPLDAHPEYGNNVQLGARLGLVADAKFGEQGLGLVGNFAGTLAQLIAHIVAQLRRTPVVVGPEIFGSNVASLRVAWCTGAAQGMFQEAIDAGAQVYISGEISEPTAHLAREMGVTYIAAGHHATERYGVAALGAHLAAAFGIAHQFIDIDNPA